MNYVRFTEANEWEGETWHFFIPLEGNEKVLDRLRNLVEGLNAEEGDAQFTVASDTLSDGEVEVLSRSNEWVESGYMPTFNKLSGTLTLPIRISNQDEDVDWNEMLDAFYKGGIRKMMSSFVD